MDPITAAIIAALAAGAASGATDVAKNALVDSYKGLKGLIQRKFGGESNVAKAVDALQESPASAGKKMVLDEEVKAANVSADPEIAASAKSLLELLKALPGGDHTVVTTTGIGNAVAVGGSTVTSTISIGGSIDELEKMLRMAGGAPVKDSEKD
jgi:hypothetical protein